MIIKDVLINKSVVRDDDARTRDWKNRPMRCDKKEYIDDRDAINRNMRRHHERWNSDGTPKRESTIFESVRFLSKKL